MRRFFCFIFSFIFILPAIFVFNTGKASAAAQNSGEIAVQGKSAILLDADTGEVLFASNEKERLPIASMTKIMTLLLAFEEIDAGRLDLGEEVLVSENASGMGGSQVFLDANTNYTLSDLIKSITVSSANDASVAVAERISGSEQSFVQKMNEKAGQLGLENTNFVNCTGLPAEGGYSCANDVAVMFRELIKHPKYFDFSTIYLDTLTHPSGRETQLSNTNKLVRFYEGCDGGKTGSTSEAKFCLCATAKRSDIRVIACVIGCENSKIRNAQVSNLFNYAFNNFRNKKLVDVNDYVTIPVNKASKQSFVAGPEEGFSLTTKVSDENSIEIKQTIFENLSAPILKGQKVGEISIFKNNQLIKAINIVAKEDVLGKGYIDSLRELFRMWSF